MYHHVEHKRGGRVELTGHSSHKRATQAVPREVENGASVHHCALRAKGDAHIQPHGAHARHLRLADTAYLEEQPCARGGRGPFELRVAEGRQALVGRYHVFAAPKRRERVRHRWFTPSRHTQCGKLHENVVVQPLGQRAPSVLAFAHEIGAQALRTGARASERV